MNIVPIYTVKAIHSKKKYSGSALVGRFEEGIIVKLLIISIDKEYKLDGVEILRYPADVKFINLDSRMEYMEKLLFDADKVAWNLFNRKADVDELILIKMANTRDIPVYALSNGDKTLDYVTYVDSEEELLEALKVK